MINTLFLCSKYLELSTRIAFNSKNHTVLPIATPWFVYNGDVRMCMNYKVSCTEELLLDLDVVRFGALVGGCLDNIVRVNSVIFIHSIHVGHDSIGIRYYAEPIQ